MSCSSSGYAISRGSHYHPAYGSSKGRYAKRAWSSCAFFTSCADSRLQQRCSLINSSNLYDSYRTDNRPTNPTFAHSSNMAEKRNASITSYFQPTSDSKGKSKASMEGIGLNDTKTSTEQPEPKPQIKGNGKRQASASPPAPAVKRPDTTTSSKQAIHLAYDDLPSNWHQDASSTDATPNNDNTKSIHLTYHKGNIFAAPSNSLLIHACNTQGHWGAGIAKAFKIKYPKAYLVHNTFCSKKHNPKTKPVPTGTAQLLAPVDVDTEHWIGCVFTSAKYGKAKDKPDQILRNTARSMEMLLELVKVAGEQGEQGIEVIRMCKINSGKFGVPWERTEEVLKGIVLREGWMGEIEVWEPSDD